MSNNNDHVSNPVPIPNKLVCTDDNLIKRIKYKDIILSDSESEFETESETESNIYTNSKVILQKNNKNKFVKKQFIKSNIELLDRHDICNKYFIKSIKFLEKNYLYYVEKQIIKVDNYHTDIYLDLIYKIKFYYSVSEYEDIINIYKNIKKELILDYEKILRHNNLILDQNPDENLKYSINWFVIKVDYKYYLTNKYFDNEIKYYSFLLFVNKNIYNYALIIGLIAILVNFLLKSNYKTVFDLDLVY